MMNKQTPDTYYNVSSSVFKHPKDILPFKSSKLLVADEGVIGLLDTSVFPPTKQSYSAALLNESKHSPFGLAFITADQNLVQDYSGGAILISVLSAFIFSWL